tara:strand:+ start:554 stop:2404 length:1851 start_codon:yes stop_codon:yes gene_type:complete
MGISLGDIASFATGVVDADERATQERLKDRREELRADRQFYIDLKTKKYESELANFEAEDKKYKAIQAVKSKLGDGASKSDFGAAYLQETNPTLLYQIQKDYADNPSGLQTQLALYANADFKTNTTREILDNKLKADVDAITAEYKTKLENARGDSKLINAILGKRDKEIADTIQKNEDGKSGIIIAKDISTEGDTNTKTYEYGEEKEIAFKVPAKFMKDGNVVSLREKLNSNDAQLSYKDNAVATTVQVFKDNEFAKPSGFYEKDNQTKQITGFTGAGSKLNEHITMLWGGAVNSYTDEKVYVATDGVASQASNVLREGNINNTIKERITNYIHIEQPKKWFNDRENIVAIVPFSVVDVNDNLGTGEKIFNISGKGNQKLVAEAYAEVLREYTAENNTRIIGEENGKPVYGLVKPNRQFMNDIQTELLALNGKSSALSIEIQNKIIEKLNLDKQPTENNVDAPKNKIDGTITIIKTDGTPIENVEDNEKNRKLAEEKGFTIQENKKEETSESSDVSTKTSETIVDEETDKDMLDETRLEVLTNLANSNNISDEDLLEFGDIVKLNKVPRNLRTRLFKLKMDRQKKKNDEKRANFNKKVEEINKNKNTTTAQNQDE